MSEAEAQFKFIAEAFETLSDEEKRSQYDRAGAAPSYGAGGGGGGYDPRGYGGGGYAPAQGFYAHAVDPFEIFNAFFGGRGDPFASFMVRLRRCHAACAVRCRCVPARSPPHARACTPAPLQDDDFFAPAPRFRSADPFFGGGGVGDPFFAGGAHLPSLHAQLLQQHAAMQAAAAGQRQRAASSQNGGYGGYGGGGGGGCGGGGFTSVSTSSTTTVVNGVRTTRTTTTRRHAAGRVETHTDERTEQVQPAARAAAAARLPDAYGAGGWGAPAAQARGGWGSSAVEAAAPAQRQRPPEPRGSIANFFRRAS